MQDCRMPTNVSVGTATGRKARQPPQTAQWPALVTPLKYVVLGILFLSPSPPFLPSPPSSPVPSPIKKRREEEEEEEEKELDILLYIATVCTQQSRGTQAFSIC